MFAGIKSLFKGKVKKDKELKSQTRERRSMTVVED